LVSFGGLTGKDREQGSEGNGKTLEGLPGREKGPGLEGARGMSGAEGTGSQDDGKTNNGKNKQQQRHKQIPFGDDNQRNLTTKET
jgi:hypothetical protein